MNTRIVASPPLVWVLALVLVLSGAEHGLAAAVSAERGPTSAVAVPAEASNAAAASAAVVEGRGHGMKDMMMNPYMLIPQLITLGFAPIVLANLKMMVMSALMINNMALNAAIFMTIRNIVFGPRPSVKYVNYGYRNTHHDHHQHHHPGDNLNDHHQRGEEHHVSGQSAQLEQKQHEDEDIETIFRRKRTGHVVT